MGSQRQAPPLVLGHLERVSSAVFDKYSRELTELISRKHGVYALYKRNRLYYVGLASNLRNRIKHHRLDRHKGKWDHFSLYLVRKSDHIKELESLILRVADPTGNAVKGRLRHAENLRPQLEAKLRSRLEDELRTLLDKGHPRPRKSSARAAKSRTPVLAPLVRKRMQIRASYKGKRYSASVRKDGTIQYRGEVFTSPSLAARAVVGRSSNGWQFWRYNRRGEWVPLDALRRPSLR